MFCGWEVRPARVADGQKSVRHTETETNRDGETQTERQTQGERERETDRQRERQREREEQADKQASVARPVPNTQPHSFGFFLSGRDLAVIAIAQPLAMAYR